MSNATLSAAQRPTPGPVIDLEGKSRVPGWAMAVGFVVVIGATLGVFRVIAPDAGVIGPSIVGMVIYFILAAVVLQITQGGRIRKDTMATVTITLAFVLAVIPLLSLLWSVIVEGGGRMTASFLTHNGESLDDGGIAHAIWGTLEITLSTSIIAIPLGVFTAIYLVEYGRGPLKKVITFLVDIMTGIPSIVAGLFAAALFPFLMNDPSYSSGMMGAAALVILMTPIVIRNTEEMLRLVSRELHEASYALGVTKARTIVSVVLRTAASGIVSGCVIAMARIIGESAPLLFTAGTTNYFNFSIFSDSVETLPVYVYIAYKGGHFAESWGAALVLVLIVLVLNLVARWIARRFASKENN